MMQESVEAILLAFWADYGSDAAEEADVVAALGAENVRNVLQRAHDEVGEGRRKSERCAEIYDGDLVFAGLDGLGAVEGQGALGVELVKLLLCLDGGEDVDDELAVRVELVAGDIIGDVGEEVGEERDFEELIEGDGLPVCDALGGRARRGGLRCGGCRGLAVRLAGAPGKG